MKLLCHINGDGDILKAWFDWHCKLGVDSFHFIVHGPQHENTMLQDLSATYPIVIEDTYEGEFLHTEKATRLNQVARRMRGEWIVSIDSDEFLELPYASLAETVDRLEYARANALPAPMMQRLRLDGSLGPAGTIDDPFSQFPLCVEGLYLQMGVRANVRKYPLFSCSRRTDIEAGNHVEPMGKRTSVSGARGVTHHFKWRHSVIKRLKMRTESTHEFRHESVDYLDYLERNAFRLPLEGAFPYSRSELFRRGLLKKVSVWRQTRAFVARPWRRKSSAVRGAMSST